MSGEITAAMAELVADLTALGIPATSDPEIVLATIAGGDIVALVGPPVATLEMLSGVLALEIPLHIACNPPGTWSDFEPIWDMLPAILVGCGQAIARTVALTVSGQTLPAYALTVLRSVAI